MPMSPRLLRPRAAGGFDPRRIAGLALWLDATVSSSITVATGVSQWNDLSGNNRHVSQGIANNQPAYTGSINGKPALSFDAQNDTLATSSAVTLMDANYGMSMFCVATRTAGVTVAAQDDFTPPRPWSWRLRWATGMAYFYGSATNVLTVPDNGNPFVGTLQQTASGVSQRYNGGTVGTLATAPPAVLFNKTLFIGSLAGNQFFGGLLGEFLIYARELSTPERQAVEAYLATKWGVTLT